MAVAGLGGEPHQLPDLVGARPARAALWAHWCAPRVKELPDLQRLADAVTPGPRISRLTLKVCLPSGLSDLQLVTVQRAVKSCPAYRTLVRQPPGAGDLLSHR